MSYLPARTTLQVIAEASRAAGLDGWIEVCDGWAPGDGALKRFTVEDVCNGLSDDLLTQIRCRHDVLGAVFDSGDPKKRCDNLPGAVLIVCVYGDTVEALEEHAAFLNGVGLITHIVSGERDEISGDWNYDTDSGRTTATLFVAAITPAPCKWEGPEHSALLCLASLKDRDAEWCGLPLNIPIFSRQPSAAEYVKQKAIAPERLIELAARWEGCGKKHDLFKQLYHQDDEAREDPKSLVPGLVPFNAVTLLVGQFSTGKSTLAHALAVVAGIDRRNTDWPPATWLGVELTNERAGGMVALLSGEDEENLLVKRSKILNADGRASSIIQMKCNKTSIARMLDNLAAVPNLRLLIVDPARSFLDGDEQSSDSVSHLFDSLQSVVDRTGAAAILVHHTNKDVKIGGLQGFYKATRGSSVYLDRPRSVIGVFQRKRSGPFFVGIVKWNMLDPPFGGEVLAEQAFVRDKDTLQLVPMFEAVAANRKTAPAAAQDAQDVAPSTNRNDSLPDLLVAAVARLSAYGEVVTRTGRSNSLYARKLPELKDYTRAAIGAQIEALVGSGAIVAEAGRLTVPRPA